MVILHAQDVRGHMVISIFFLVVILLYDLRPFEENTVSGFLREVVIAPWTASCL